MPFYYAHLQNVYDKNKRTGIAIVISILNTLSIKPVLVRYSSGEEQGSEIDVEEYDFERTNYTISSRQPIVKKVQGLPIWRYVPFNLFNEQLHYQHFFNKVKNSLRWNDAKLQDAEHWTDQDIKDLRGVYNSFRGTTINDNSLIILSDKPKDGYFGYAYTVHAEYYKQHGYCSSCRCHISCLYTGDSVLRRGVRKTSKYVDRYESFLQNLLRYTDRISLMQIPHHGSGNNSNISSLCDCMSLRLFCNYSSSDLATSITILSLPKLESVWKNIYAVTDNTKTVFEEKCLFWI